MIDLVGVVLLSPGVVTFMLVSFCGLWFFLGFADWILVGSCPSIKYIHKLKKLTVYIPHIKIRNLIRPIFCQFDLFLQISIFNIIYNLHLRDAKADIFHQKIYYLTNLYTENGHYRQSIFLLHLFGLFTFIVHYRSSVQTSQRFDVLSDHAVVQVKSEV